MRKQQQVWQKMYQDDPMIGSIADNQPSSHVIWFVNFLKTKNIKPNARIIDIGCGKGGNTIYLATSGFSTLGIDYIENALEHGRKRANEENVSHKASFENVDIDKPWPYPDDFFDAAIDCFSSIDIETPEGRETYRDELYRVLRPQGFALIMVVAAEDEIESTFAKGPETNSTIWPENGKFQKNYDEEELREFYKKFKVTSLGKIQKPARKLNKTFTTTIFRMILQK